MLLYGVRPDPDGVDYPAVDTRSYESSMLDQETARRISQRRKGFARFFHAGIEGSIGVSYSWEFFHTDLHVAFDVHYYEDPTVAKVAIFGF